MLNPDFYPTPRQVIRKMLAPFDELHMRHILEPSAGKGDIIDAIIETVGRHQKPTLYAIESDPELAATLTGKGYRVLAHDFLTFIPSHIFDLILMNPPFSNGDAHLLHAWEILDSGDIVCLLNAETIVNPHTAKRRLLAEIIEKHGTVELLGPVFQTAERRTDVEVALVRLHKEATGPGIFFDEQTKESVYSISDEDHGEIALKDSIGTMVDAYEAAKRSFAEIWKVRKRIERYLAHIGGLTQFKEVGEQTDFLAHAIGINNPVTAYNWFVDEARRNAWNTVFEKTGIAGKVTGDVRRDFDRLREEIGFDFTEENIASVIGGLMDNRGEIMKRCIVAAFDLMTRYHKENRVHVEGWSTNDRWMVSRKVILPFAVTSGWHYGFRAQYRAQEELNDIDKACCFLTGKSFETILTTVNAIEKAQETESEFFRLKSHKKGTLHLTFKDVKLWERFNATACEGKNWLPGRKAG